MFNTKMKYVMSDVTTDAFNSTAMFDYSSVVIGDEREYPEDVVVSSPPVALLDTHGDKVDNVVIEDELLKYQIDDVVDLGSGTECKYKCGVKIHIDPKLKDGTVCMRCGAIQAVCPLRSLNYLKHPLLAVNSFQHLGETDARKIAREFKEGMIILPKILDNNEADYDKLLVECGWFLAERSRGKVFLKTKPPDKLGPDTQSRVCVVSIQNCEVYVTMNLYEENIGFDFRVCGHIKMGETPLQALQREAREEIRRPLKKPHYLGVSRMALWNDEKKSVYSTVYVFVETDVSGMTRVRDIKRNTGLFRPLCWPVFEYVSRSLPMTNIHNIFGVIRMNVRDPTRLIPPDVFAAYSYTISVPEAPVVGSFVQLEKYDVDEVKLMVDDIYVGSYVIHDRGARLYSFRLPITVPTNCEHCKRVHHEKSRCYTARTLNALTISLVQQNLDNIVKDVKTCYYYHHDYLDYIPVLSKKLRFPTNVCITNARGEMHCVKVVGVIDYDVISDKIPYTVDVVDKYWIVQKLPTTSPPRI